MSKIGRYSADRKKIEDLTADKTIQVADCGTVFMLKTATGLTASLPNAADAGKGWWCKFIVATDITNGTYAYAISGTLSDDINIEAVQTFTSAAASVTAGSSAPITSPDATAGTAVGMIEFKAASSVGDQIELMTDGTNWYALGHSYDAAAMNFS